MIDFLFSDLHADRPDSSDYYQVLLGVNCHFAVGLDDLILYEEAGFPVLEFVEQLTAWLTQTPEPSNDFSYDSVESDVHSLIWIRRSGPGWRIGSANHAAVAYQPFPLQELRSAVSQLVERLLPVARHELGFDITPFTTGDARHTYEARLPPPSLMPSPTTVAETGCSITGETCR